MVRFHTAALLYPTRPAPTTLDDVEFRKIQQIGSLLDQEPMTSRVPGISGGNPLRVLGHTRPRGPLGFQSLKMFGLLDWWLAV